MVCVWVCVCVGWGGWVVVVVGGGGGGGGGAAGGGACGRVGWGAAGGTSAVASACRALAGPCEGGLGVRAAPALFPPRAAKPCARPCASTATSPPANPLPPPRAPSPPPLQVKAALPALARLIHSQDEEVLTDACWALSYLSDGTNDKIQEVINSGVCRRLVELLL